MNWTSIWPQAEVNQLRDQIQAVTGISKRIQVTRYFIAENFKTGKKNYYAIVALDQPLGFAHVTFSKVDIFLKDPVELIEIMYPKRLCDPIDISKIYNL